MDISLTLKNGDNKVFPVGTTPLEVARSISPRLAREALVARYNGQLVDLGIPLKSDGDLELLSFTDPEVQRVYRHSTAHVMAQAVKRLFPEVKLGIGPAIEDGYYYDFDTEHLFSPEEVESIEAEIQKIISSDIPFLRQEISREEAISLFCEMGEPYKVELVEDLPDNVLISLYRQGDFVDLCAGPHIPSTGRLGAVKILSTAGAYWRGSERNKMLRRLYGTSFPDNKQLKEHLNRIEEARKRDHRRVGIALNLFSMHNEGPGFPFFHPKGMELRNRLEAFWRREHKRRGYFEIKTPVILNKELWEKSGHWDHYRENMYFTKIDETDFAVKPMNCPGAMLVYNSQQHSYRDFPLRYAELGLVHRHEKSGVLHGLMRVRAFTQDDAHIFMTPDQVIDEIQRVIDAIDYIYQIFGFEYHVELSTRPEKAMGSEEVWEKATAALEAALEQIGLEYQVNEGDGAFYGPKIDFHLKDSLGRTWQCGTIQLDFLMPEKFDLTYVGDDGLKHQPVMVHRVLFGSIERFIGILVEHYGGAFPFWLAPVQVRVLPIADRHLEYAKQIRDFLQEDELSVEVDSRNEKIGHKIRDAQVEKIPYMLILGDAEVADKVVSLRHRETGDLGRKGLQEVRELFRQESSPQNSSQ